MSIEFRATLYRVGMNYCVDVPDGISRGWESASLVPMTVTAAGEVGMTTAVRRADGNYRIFLDTKLRTAAKVRSGDRVLLRVAPLAGELPEPSVPDDLDRALSRSKTSRAAWEALTLRQRRDFCRYLGEAKSPAARASRLATGLERVREKAERSVRLARARGRAKK